MVTNLWPGSVLYREIVYKRRDDPLLTKSLRCGRAAASLDVAAQQHRDVVSDRPTAQFVIHCTFRLSLTLW